MVTLWRQNELAGGRSAAASNTVSFHVHIYESMDSVSTESFSLLITERACIINEQIFKEYIVN